MSRGVGSCSLAALLVAVLLFAALAAVPSSALGQELASVSNAIKRDGVLDPADADGDVIRAVGPSLAALDAEIARLDALRSVIDTDATEACLAISAQLVFYASLATTLGAVVELIAQSLRSRPWEDTTPVFLLGGGAVGAGMAAIGAPLLAACSSDHGYRRAERIARRRGAVSSRRAATRAPAEGDPIPPPPPSYIEARLVAGGLALSF
ncbi:MAG: hypothetical protein U0353_31215 [Sandaracinus sp.]